MMHWYTNGHGMNGGAYTLMIIGTVVFLGLVAAGILALVRHTGAGNQQMANTLNQGSPAQILAERLARGDIDNDEYWRRMGTLRGSAGPK